MNLKQTFRTMVKGSEFRVHYNETTCRAKLTKNLESRLFDLGPHRPIVIVCIGTDRSTGDSLGPLVGMNLEKHSQKKYYLYGTLDTPVHAVNLSAMLDDIHRKHNNAFIIAVDACLGRHNNVGLITVADGPVIPGAGVKKDLPPVGDIHITGIVNVSGYMEYFVLQNTRLSLVMNMAQIISDCLHQSITRMGSKQKVAKITLK
ncbi:spore protease YyaC [Camelliibacillus cellulosilyticus]|uniref:Spore protease YyaC n=1 Tax=Camelliibacillus cellulosilyticus TaxID=2174486 RepID=A0ABV9GSS1_9BACL